MAIKQERYGWHPSLPDFRDLRLESVARLGATPPRSVDLTPNMPPVRDQGELGSCTGFGSTSAYYATTKATRRVASKHSALFAYYNARRLEGTTRYDSGATVRDVVKGLARWGAATEEVWPYSGYRTRYDDTPTATAYTNAAYHQAVAYYAVPQTGQGLRAALALGYPIIIGFSVFESFESSEVERTGIVPMPSRNEEMVGGHCVALCGYDNANPNVWVCQNSWGTGWGQRGYFRMPEQYLTDPTLSGDFWQLRVTEG